MRIAGIKMNMIYPQLKMIPKLMVLLKFLVRLIK